MEGYGSVCDCDHPAPIDELSSQNSPVLNNQVSFLLFILDTETNTILCLTFIYFHKDCLMFI